MYFSKVNLYVTNKMSKIGIEFVHVKMLTFKLSKNRIKQEENVNSEERR